MAGCTPCPVGSGSRFMFPTPFPPGSFVRAPDGSRFGTFGSGRSLGRGQAFERLRERASLQGATISVECPLHRGDQRGNSSSSGVDCASDQRHSGTLVCRRFVEPCDSRCAKRWQRGSYPFTGVGTSVVHRVVSSSRTRTACRTGHFEEL
jgi:hypothetical protein